MVQRPSLRRLLGGPILCGLAFTCSTSWLNEGFFFQRAMVGELTRQARASFLLLILESRAHAFIAVARLLFECVSFRGVAATFSCHATRQPVPSGARTARA